MRPGHPASAVVDSQQLKGGAEQRTSDSYACVLCGAHWAYPEIHNTARCPECGGGLVRDLATDAAS